MAAKPAAAGTAFLDGIAFRGAGMDCRTAGHLRRSSRGKSTGMPPIERVQGPDIKGLRRGARAIKLRKKGKSTDSIDKIVGKPIENNSLELF
jgi:hypothetical protein